MNPLYLLQIVAAGSSNTDLRDVLRRHWKSCKTRLEKGQEMPEIHRGGKHKRACDNCASIRKACNGQNPCSGCIQRERPCTYQRLYEDPDAGGAPSDADTVTDANTVTIAESQRSPTAEMEVDVPDRQEAWNLGPQNFYASSVPVGKIVYSRNRYGT